MRKIQLQEDALAVESFEPQETPEQRMRGTVRGEQGDTVVRSCQTKQFNCTAQGG